MRAPLSALAPAAALASEWLLLNDRGTLASGTVSGARVRLRHIALATTDASGLPVPQLLLLDARAGSGSRAFDLAWRPPEPRSLGVPCATIESFEREPWPTWRYRAGDTLIEHQLLLVHDYAALVAVWRHVEGPALPIAVTPAFAAGAAAAGEANLASPERMGVQAIPGRVRLGLNGNHRLTLWHDGSFLPVRSWRIALDGAADVTTCLAPRERGEVPGFVEAPLGPDAALHVVISTEESLLRRLAERERLGTPPPKTLAGCVEAIMVDERRRLDAAARIAREAAAVTARDAWTARHPDAPAPAATIEADDARIPRLARALDLWAERGRESRRVPAPYLAAGGVDALRAVRALVSLRRFEAAREILLTLGQLQRDGIVPSSFDATGAPRYESPAAALWLVIAAETFARRAGEGEFVRHSLYAPLEHVIDRYREGTRLGLHVTDDGLLAAGEGDTRADLNALWYTAQAAMGQLARAAGQKHSAALYLARAREQQARFNEVLWDDALGAPFVTRSDAGSVRGLEPGMLLAASLSPPVLPLARSRSMVDTIESQLMTPAGPREAPDSPRILPGWMGHFLTALVRARGRDTATQAHARALLARFEAALDRHAAGQVPECIEIDAGGALDGALMQAAGEPVSLAGTAELLRFWIEEIDHAESDALVEG